MQLGTAQDMHGAKNAWLCCHGSKPSDVLYTPEQ